MPYKYFIINTYYWIEWLWFYKIIFT